MKHVTGTRAWRPDRPRKASRGTLGLWSALVFNVCMVLAPIAAASAAYIIARDNLYSYKFSDSAARNVRARVEKLSATLIQVEFDRKRQWDDLVAMELMSGDIVAARGFLLSAPTMLPTRDANQLKRGISSSGGDAELEQAALDQLTPGTRARYESTVPLLSRRAATADVTRREAPANLGDARDFELMARAMLTDADSDPMRFVLAGYGLGLGGEFTPRMAAGAAALVAASRREDFPPALADQFAALVNPSVPMARFRAEAMQRTPARGDPAAYSIAAPAFRAALDARQAERVKAVLDEIGAMSEATNTTGAALLLTHARDLTDIPRLRLVAQSAGDRAVAAAKRLERDGRLARVARGDLAFSKDLTLPILGLVLAMLGLIAASLGTAFQAGRAVWRRLHDVRTSDELVRSFSRLNPL